MASQPSKLDVDQSTSDSSDSEKPETNTATGVTVETRQNETPVTVSPLTEIDRPQPRNWQAVLEEYLQERSRSAEAQEIRRAAMWAQSRSVMFAPPDQRVFDEPPPLLPDLEFAKPDFDGLGFAIGKYCYFGIPATDSDSSRSAQTISLLSCTVRF